LKQNHEKKVNSGEPGGAIKKRRLIGGGCQWRRTNTVKVTERDRERIRKEGSFGIRRLQNVEKGELSYKVAIDVALHRKSQGLSGQNQNGV